jgi:hypothetical protein
MRNLRRRIEALEKARTAACSDRQLIAKKALAWFWLPEREQLISAHGAEREGRELSEAESAAKLAYTQALIRECRSAGYPFSIEGCEGALDILEAIVGAFRVSDEELRFAINAWIAAQEGRTATQEESAALQKCNAEWFRLGRLAGFPTPAEADVPEDSAP